MTRNNFVKRMKLKIVWKVMKNIPVLNVRMDFNYLKIKQLYNMNKIILLEIFVHKII